MANENLLDGSNNQYNSRLDRARAANSARRGVNDSSPLPKNGEIPYGRFSTGSPASGSPTAAAFIGSPPAAATVLLPADEPNTDARWAYSPAQQRLAVVDAKQLLMIIDHTGSLEYRVQLPPEGQTIFIGWEPGGSVLAAVQKLGGAFLWFPSKPENVQQWEGMQFSTKVLSGSLLKRNSHFNACFASWSSAGKLVLGLTDGNFALWDLASNQTFMSRKHFAGKHKGGITCGAWGPRGDTLALGSENQVKVSQPLQNASWDQTATKLHLPANADATGGFQQLLFSKSGQLLAAFAGSSVFRHLCLYAVIDQGKRGSELTPVGEAHPSPSVGSIQAAIWLEGDVMLVLTSNGFVRLMRWDRIEEAMTEELLRVCEAGVIGAVPLPSGHIAIARSVHVLVWDPVARAAAVVVDLVPMPRNVRLMAVEAAAQPDEPAVIVARSDGELSRVPLPRLPVVDTELVRVNPSGSGAASPAKPLSVGSPHVLLHVTPEEGALHRRLEPLHHAWSPEMQQLAIVNADSQLLVFSAEDGRCVLRNPLPQAPCTFLQWDPSTGKTVALTLRGSGVGIWTADTGADVKMWTGMQSSGAFLRLSADSSSFDPTSACWSRAGQLAVGMSDGSFAVWDSVSSQVSTSGRSGKHKAAVTAGDWIDSLFAPALALASRDTIKVSKGFEAAGWEATAVKLKLGRGASGAGEGPVSPLSRLGSSSSGLMRKARADPEGLEFVQLKFSAGGKYLAALAFPSTAPAAAQVVLYEVQNSRETLVAVRDYTGSPEGDRPFSMGWVGEDRVLIVFSRSGTSGSVHALVPSGGGIEREFCWPIDGQSAPGPMVGAACTPAGLVAAVFDTGGGGVAMLLGAQLEALASFALAGVPRAMSLHAPTTHGAGAEGATLIVSFEEGGVQVWRL